MKQYTLKDFQITLIVMIIFNFLLLFYNAGVASIDYLMYKIGNAKYSLYEGEIINFDYASIIPSRVSREKGTIYFTKADILYKINGKDNYAVNIKSFSDKKSGENVLIAVSDNKVRRGEPYELTFIDFLLLCSVLISFLIILIIHFYKIRQEKKERVTRKREDKELQKKMDEKSQSIILQKQKNIINQYKEVPRTENVSVILKELNESNIVLNEECLWYIRQGLHINGVLINEYHECETVTRNMRRVGLEKDYYVIEKCDNYCLCCHSSLPRVYSFSENLGITNTIYCDFYDYILKKLYSQESEGDVFKTVI